MGSLGRWMTLKKVNKQTFDSIYESLLESDNLDRLPKWNGKEGSITWKDSSGKDVLKIKGNKLYARH